MFEVDRRRLRREAGGAESQVAIAGRPDDGDVGRDRQGGGRNAALAGDHEAPLGAAASQGRSAGGPAGWRVSTARHGVTV